MTPEQQNTWWNKYNTFHTRKANQYEPLVYKALQAQLKHFAENRNIDFIPMQPVADVIKKMYLDIGPLWAHQSYLSVMGQVSRKSLPVNLQLKIRMPIGFNEQFIQDILSYFQLRLLNDAVAPITETTRDFIRDVLTRGVAEGKGIDELVKEILSSDITVNRARLIARTETMKAASYGEQAGANKTGLRTTKIWIATRDNRTRRDHREVDNQVQPDGKPFIVGVEGFQMQRPGVSVSDDGRKIPAKEVVNCRCTVGRRVLRGANGLPLRA